MKKGKSFELDERKQQILIYVGLLATAVFLTLRNPNEKWLPLGLAAGLALGALHNWFQWKKQKKTQGSGLDAEAQEDGKNQDQSLSE